MKQNIIQLHTSAPAPFQEVARSIKLPHETSHKGENGRLLIVGGSHSFHAASLWAAEIASQIVDIVHYASTDENNQILLSLRKKFRNGIVVSQKDIPAYIHEDNAILIGPGMERGTLDENEQSQQITSYTQLLSFQREELYTYHFIRYVLAHYPEERYVFDAAALQMLKAEWLQNLKHKPVLTPHQKEFEKLFGVSIEYLPLEEKIRHTIEYARMHNCVILLKAITDVITDGSVTYTVTGGNQGLTKGGTGDVLAGLTGSFYTKNDPLLSAVCSSYVLKKTADTLYTTHGYWYNVEKIIETVPFVLKEVLSSI